MNNIQSLYQIQETGGLNADLIIRQCKLDKMAKFMEIKSNNPKLNNLNSQNYWNYVLLRYNDMDEK